MSQDPHLENVFFKSRPKTYRALQQLVRFAAKSQNNLGKKGLFGGDKFQPAFNDFKRSVYELCEALDEDGDMVVIHMDDSWSKFGQDKNYLAYINHMMDHFKTLFPNWPDAYSFWDGYYNETQKQGIKRLNQ